MEINGIKEIWQGHGRSRTTDAILQTPNSLSPRNPNTHTMTATEIDQSPDHNLRESFGRRNQKL